MRNRAWIALAPAVLAWAAGCTMPDHPRALSWVDQVRASAALDPNSVIVETALIEQPAGDPYLASELWQHTDELIVDLDRRAALEENGIRVGQLVGTPPTGFQTLLLSKRSCSAPKGLVAPAGKLLSYYLNPVPKPCSFDHVVGDDVHEIDADQARFGLEIVPTLTSDGRTKLKITPKLEAGENQLPFQPSPEQSTWVLRIERPCRRFADLSWEVTLAPGQYLLIGGRNDRTGRYGHSAFIDEDATRPVQRLLALRTIRSLQGQTAPALDDYAESGRVPPLALQAAIPAVRAKGQ